MSEFDPRKRFQQADPIVLPNGKTIAQVKFNSIQDDYRELIAYLKTKGIRATCFVFAEDPNLLVVRGAGTYRGLRWLQEHQCHIQVGRSAEGWPTIAESFHQKAEEEWNKR